MLLTGTQLIAAPRDQVWAALNDPAILKQCLPGCDTVERVADDQFKVVIAMSIGPLRARFTGSLKLTEPNPPASCVMVFEGQGGAIGFGKGTAEVTLTETAEGTELSYSAKAQVGGKLAQVGGRLIDSVAHKMSEDFFRAFKQQLSPAPEVAPAAAPAAATAAPATTASPSSAAPVPVTSPTVTAAPVAGQAHQVVTVVLQPSWAWGVVGLLVGLIIGLLL